MRSLRRLVFVLGVPAFLVAPAFAYQCEALVQQAMDIREYCAECDICTDTGYEECIWLAPCGSGDQCDNYLGYARHCGIGWRPVIAASCGGR